MNDSETIKNIDSIPNDIIWIGVPLSKSGDFYTVNNNADTFKYSLKIAPSSTYTHSIPSIIKGGMHSDDDELSEIFGDMEIKDKPQEVIQLHARHSVVPSRQNRSFKKRDDNLSTFSSTPFSSLSAVPISKNIGEKRKSDEQHDSSKKENIVNKSKGGKTSKRNKWKMWINKTMKKYSQ